MEHKITSEDIMNHYASVFGSRRKVLDEWIKSSREDKLLTNSWIYKTDALNILFGERRQTKDMNLVDAWA
jgi:hypothetical protein